MEEKRVHPTVIRTLSVSEAQMAFLEINATRVIIVDGQHRVSALRALEDGSRFESKEAATTDVTA